jgi:dipicolinate synthase subunit B
MMELKQQRLRGVKIGVILTGSHCTINDVIPEIKHLINEGADVLPVFSYTVDNSDNRFYRVEDLKKTITDLTDHEIINTIVGAEPIGPQKLLDIVVVAPATGNTIAVWWPDLQQ